MISVLCFSILLMHFNVKAALCGSVLVNASHVRENHLYTVGCHRWKGKLDSIHVNFDQPCGFLAQRASHQSGCYWDCTKPTGSPPQQARTIYCCCEIWMEWRDSVAARWPLEGPHLTLIASFILQPCVFCEISEVTGVVQISSSLTYNFYSILYLTSDRDQEPTAWWRERGRGASCPRGQVRFHPCGWTHLTYPGGVREDGHPHCRHQTRGHCCLRCWCCGTTLRCRQEERKNRLATVLFEHKSCLGLGVPPSWLVWQPTALIVAWWHWPRYNNDNNLICIAPFMQRCSPNCLTKTE